MNRLLKIGFKPVGNWSLNENDNIQFNLKSDHNEKNILYAFVVNAEIKYIGKTIRTFNSRMYGYQNPGPTQSTNIRVNALIKEAVAAEKSVDILILVTDGLLNYGGYEINLAAGLEDNLISIIRPEWNLSGKKKLVEDKESEETDKAKEPIPEVKAEIQEVSRFSVTLGSAYFNQGFFNIPVDYSKYFADDKSEIEILLGDTTNSILGYINRQANRNTTPRIMGGVPLRNWVKTNFKESDTMTIKVLSANSIQLLK